MNTCMTQGRSREQRARRFCAAIATLTALCLTACGGGNDSVSFDVGVVVGGQPLSGVQIVSGGRQSITIFAGQSIELDASEPVFWTLEVGGSTITGSATVFYGGAAITQTMVSSSRIIVDTSAAFPLAAPVPITFDATSTFDSAVVAVVDVLITN